MGFFSAIKKFLGSDTTQTKESTPAPQEPVEQIEQSAQDSPEAHVPEQTAKQAAEHKSPESAPESAPEQGQAEQVDPKHVETEQSQCPEATLMAEPAPAQEVAPSIIEDAPELTAGLSPELTAEKTAPEQEPEVVLEDKAEPTAKAETLPSTPEPSQAMDSPKAETPEVSFTKATSYSGLDNAAQAALSLSLRSVEPRLSAWLEVVTEGINTVSPLLWQRLRFLLESLEAPQSEAENFVQDFQSWLTRMEYEYVEEFRSELQYRLALALELEDEEDERNRLFVKLSDGLARTREHFTRQLDALFASHGALNDSFWEEMEELFIMADVGFESSMQLIERLKDAVRKQGLTEPQQLRAVLQEELTTIFQMPRRIASYTAPEVIMMIGVNGVGKTTTIAKLAHRDRMQGKKVLIAAADTFRAAATEQLGVWAERVGADFHRKDAGADPAAVAFEAMDLALRGGYDVLYVDTAGRLQTKVNLMEELTKIRNVIAKKHAGAPHRSILVVDATTGQNALSQTKLFKEAAGIDEIILSKLDGTAKGGVAISVALQFQIPITYVGLGEKLEDLRPFNGKDFALALLGVKNTSE